MPLQIYDLTDSQKDLALLSSFYETLYIKGFPDADERESLPRNFTRNTGIN